jgi:hypothetical protein
MFITPDKIIDQIQSSKKQIVNTFVQDEKFKAELIKLIDAQATFAKGSVQSSLDIMQAFMKNGSTAFYKKG